MKVCGGSKRGSGGNERIGSCLEMSFCTIAYSCPEKRTARWIWGGPCHIETIFYSHDVLAFWVGVVVVLGGGVELGWGLRGKGE